MGQNIAGVMNTAMSGVNQPLVPGTMPPPIPVVAYHVAINGQAAGPFDLATLKQMATAGQLTATTLVWKKGMAGWVEAATVEDLKSVIGEVPPIPN